MNIFLLEDNDAIIKGLEYSFKLNNYKLISARNLEEAQTYLKSNKPNLIILDISLPDGNGLNLYNDLIKNLNIPTIFLTALDDEDTIVKCFNLGCDDYITKPFSSKELLARVKRILLRNKNNSVIIIQNIKFDLDKMIVYKNDVEVSLTSLEKNLLSLLFLNINKTVRRGAILDKIWELTGNDVDDHTITVYLKRIREKLGVDIIKTVKGIGYRIDEE